MNTRLERRRIEIRKSQFAALSKSAQDRFIIEHYVSLISAADHGYKLIEEIDYGNPSNRAQAEQLLSIIADSIRVKQGEDFGFSLEDLIIERDEDHMMARERLRPKLHQMAKLFTENAESFIKDADSV